MIVFGFCRSPYHKACSVNFHLKFCDQELCILEFRNRFSKLFSFFYIFDGFVQCTLCNSYGLSSDPDPSACQCRHRDLISFSFTCDHIFFGYPYINQGNFTVGSSTDTHTRNVLADF